MWLPKLSMAEGAQQVWVMLDQGEAKRDPGRPPLDVYAGSSVAIGEGLEGYRIWRDRA